MSNDRSQAEGQKKATWAERVTKMWGHAVPPIHVPREPSQSPVGSPFVMVDAAKTSTPITSPVASPPPLWRITEPPPVSPRPEREPSPPATEQEANAILNGTLSMVLDYSALNVAEKKTREASFQARLQQYLSTTQTEDRSLGAAQNTDNTFATRLAEEVARAATPPLGENKSKHL